VKNGQLVPDVANILHGDATHLRQQAVALVPEFNEGNLDTTPLIAVGPAKPVPLITAKREAESIPAGTFSNLGEDVLEVCPTGCSESVKSVRHDEFAIVLEHDDRRELVTTSHRLGVLRHGCIADVGAGR